MRIALLILSAKFVLLGCTPIAFDYGPLASASGSAYWLKTTYGGIDGTFDQARAWLDTNSKRLCKGSYDVTREEKVPSVMGFGIQSGQTDLLWQVQCSDAALRSSDRAAK